MSNKPLETRVVEYRVRVAENNAEMPEAGAIVFMTVYLGGVPVNLTQRANNTYDALAALKMGLDLAGEAFGVTLEKEILQAPTNNKIQLTTEDGLPVVNQEGEPEMVELPKGTHLFTVKTLAHGKTQAGKSVIKVFIQENYEHDGGRYGMTAFRGGPDGWEKWSENAQYAPPEGFGHVVVSDPKEGGKYANIEMFRA